MTNNTMQYIVLAEELFTAITLNPNQPRAVTKGTGTLRMETQLKKGLLEYCVLAAVCRCDSYGYQIIKDIGGCVSISESTLYPILRRLENARCLSTYTVEHSGRLRKYYRITDLGRERMREFLLEWEQVSQIYDFIKEACGDIQSDQG